LLVVVINFLTSMYKKKLVSVFLRFLIETLVLVTFFTKKKKTLLHIGYTNTKVWCFSKLICQSMSTEHRMKQQIKQTPH
jgi:hypothetical protein